MAKSRRRSTSRVLLADRRADELAKLVEPGRVEAEAGRGRVPAVAKQRRRRAVESPDDVHPSRGARRTLGFDRVEAGDECGPRIALGEPARHQTDDAHRPAGVAEDDRRSVVVDGGDPFLGLGERHGNSLLAQTVLGVEVGGEPSRLLGVVAEAELEREARVLHAPGGVDARPDRERDVGASRRQRRARGLAERTQTGQVGDAGQPVTDDDPVLAAQRHHVGDRAERGEPERRIRATGGDYAGRLERLDELERDPGAGEPVERVGRTR